MLATSIVMLHKGSIKAAKTPECMILPVFIAAILALPSETDIPPADASLSEKEAFCRPKCGSDLSANFLVNDYCHEICGSTAIISSGLLVTELSSELSPMTE
jgi:hypothetical protein